MCCCCLPRKCVFCARLRTGCLVIAGTELAVHGVVMCFVATRIHIYGNMLPEAEEGNEEEEVEDSSNKLAKAVFEMVLGSSTTFGFGLCLDAWQTLGVLFSYLNSVALALMLAGVIFKNSRMLIAWLAVNLVALHGFGAVVGLVTYESQFKKYKPESECFLKKDQLKPLFWIFLTATLFTVYSWRVVFAYYKVLCNGGVELDSDDSGYVDPSTNANGGGVQDAHHEARMRMQRRHIERDRAAAMSYPPQYLPYQTGQQPGQQYYYAGQTKDNRRQYQNNDSRASRNGNGYGADGGGRARGGPPPPPPPHNQVWQHNSGAKV